MQCQCQVQPIIGIYRPTGTAYIGVPKNVAHGATPLNQGGQSHSYTPVSTMSYNAKFVSSASKCESMNKEEVK